MTHYTIKIEQDDSASSPREDDNLGEMIFFHKRYNIGDKHDVRADDYLSFEHMQRSLVKRYSVVIPVYMLDHSGIRLSTRDFNDQWDSGQVGFICASVKRIRECYGVKRITKKVLAQVNKSLESEVKCYDDFVAGNVYWYEVTNDDGVLEDSCSGIIGDIGDVMECIPKRFRENATYTK